MAKTLGEIEAMNRNEREDLIIPTEEIFTELRKVLLPPFFARLARCGVEIYQNKIKTSFPIGERVRLYDEKGFFALGEVMQFGENSAIKPIRQFDV